MEVFRSNCWFSKIKALTYRDIFFLIYNLPTKFVATVVVFAVLAYLKLHYEKTIICALIINYFNDFIILGNFDYADIRWTEEGKDGNMKEKGFPDLPEVRQDIEFFSRKIE